MIPISVASRIISGINQLKRGLFEAAEWVEGQAYEGSEDHDALAGDRRTGPADSLPVEEPATVATTLAEPAPTPDPLPKVSSVEVPIDSDLMSFAVPGSANVVGPPRATFEEAVRSFAIDVLAEASYREARTRGVSSEQVQYTSAYFESARVEVRNAGYVLKSPKWQPYARVFAPLSFTMTGIAIPLAFTAGSWSGWGFIGGAALVLCAALSFAVEFTRGGSR